MKLPNFLTDDSGAVTVDWVIITAAAVGISLGVMAMIANGSTDMTNDTVSVIANGALIATVFN